MHHFTIVFLVLLGAMTALQLWLATRQIRHVHRHRGAVPAAFAEKISSAAHARAADYTVAKARLGRVETVVGAALLLAWTLGGGLQALDNLWRGFGWGPLTTGSAFIFSLLFIGALLDLPFALYRTFVLEARFGFNKITPALFGADLVKKTALAIALGAPLVVVVLWLMASMGARWWLYVWLVWTGFSLLMVWAYPAFIAPLFNRFRALDRDALLQRIQALLTRTGFHSKGVFVMDGSRRSAHGNAYFTGLGRNKRIVFFDTLLGSLTDNEIEAVLAHELGHFKRRHVLQRMLTSFALSLVGLAVLGYISNQPWFYHGLGVAQPSMYMALVLFFMVVPVFTFFLQPVFAWISRRHEFEADAFAAEQADAQALTAALVKLYEENAATLTPDPLHSAFYDSHPPASVRIAHLQALASTGAFAASH